MRSAFYAIGVFILTLIYSFGVGEAETLGATMDEPQLLFRVTFDDLTANAQVSKGDGRSTLKRELGLTAKAGKKGTALLLGDGEQCAYKVKDNLNLSSGTISCWVKPGNWNDSEKRYQKFFWIYGRENGESFNFYIDSPNIKGNARAGLFFKNRRDPGYKQILVSGKADWASGKWHKLDVTWDATHLAIYVNGKLGQKIDMAGVTFPKLEARKFSLVPIFNSGDGRFHNGKDRSLIDEFEIWDGVLSSDTILQRYLTDVGGLLPPPGVSVPRTSSKIKLDGKLDEAVWKRASRVPIMINAVTSFPVANIAYAAVCYDEENLYVGFSSPRPVKKLIANAAGRDGKLWLDDSFELFLVPESGDKNAFFQWIVNSKATVFDGRGGRKEWASGATFRTHVNGDRWTVEVKVPFSDLGVSTPKVGDKWLANFCRDWPQPAPANPVFTSWSYVGGSFLMHPERFGTLTFTDATHAARLELTSSLKQGTLEVDTWSTKGKTTSVSVTSEGNAVINKTIAMEQGRAKMATQLEQVKEGVLHVTVGDKTLTYATRFMVEKPINVAPLPDVENKRLGLEVDLKGVGPRWLKIIQSGKAMLKVAFAGPKSDRGTKAVSLTGVTTTVWLPFVYEVGNYQMTYTLEAKAPMQPLVVKSTLVIPPLPWVGTQVGITDKVLSPWTPLQYKGNATVIFWGRQYEFDGPFLKQVSNQGRPMLRSPVKMSMVTASEDVDMTVDQSKAISQKPNRAMYKGTGRFGKTGPKVTWSMWTEYDGLTVVTVTINPPAGGVAIKSLSLHMPIRKDVVKYIRGTRQMGGLKTGRTDWDGQRWESDYQPYIWVTNEDEGFLYFCESEAGWVYPPNAKVVSVQGGQNAGIELKLISQPITLDKPLTYQFGFQATPVKPMAKDRREWNFGMGRLAKHQNARNWFTGYPTQSGLWKVARPKVLRQFDQSLRAKGIKMLYYGVTSCTPDSNPTYDLYKKQWDSRYAASFGPYQQKADKFREAHQPYRLVAVNPGSKSFQDMMLYDAYRMLTDCGVPGLYSDTDGIFAAENSYSGAGFTDIFGKKGVTYTILSKRRFAKRLAAIMRTVGPRRYWMTHAHAKLVPPVHAWADFWFPGEENAHQLFGDPWFYMDTLNDVAWRVEYRGATSGLPHYFLPQFVRGTRNKKDMDGPQPAESLLAMCAVNDINPTGSYMNVEAMGTYWGLRKRCKLIHAKLTAYWRKNCPVKALTSKALASIYLSSNAPVIAVANRLPQDTVVTVEVDLKAIGLTSELLKITDERTGQVLTLKGNHFSVPVQGRNYTFVSLKSVAP